MKTCTIDLKDRMKDILDRECWLVWTNKRCAQRGKYPEHIEMLCMLCHKNDALLSEILDAVGGAGLK